MTEEKKETEVEGGFNVNIGGLDLGNLLGSILGNLGNIEELLDAAEKLADVKGDSEAKEKVNKMREGLGKTGVTKEDVKAKGLGGLLSQILDFVEKAGSQEETQEFEIGGKKGVISRGIRIGGLGGSGRQPSEKFEAKRHEPKVQRTEKKPVAEENTRRLELDVFDEKDHILIIGDMPGVTKEDIKYELKERTLRIYTETGRKYGKEIELPSPVTQEVKWNYKNGVLEVTLTKKYEGEK